MGSNSIVEAITLAGPTPVDEKHSSELEEVRLKLVSLFIYFGKSGFYYLHCFVGAVSSL